MNARKMNTAKKKFVIGQQENDFSPATRYLADRLTKKHLRELKSKDSQRAAKPSSRPVRLLLSVLVLGATTMFLTVGCSQVPLIHVSEDVAEVQVGRQWFTQSKLVDALDSGQTSFPMKIRLMWAYSALNQSHLQSYESQKRFWQAVYKVVQTADDGCEICQVLDFAAQQRSAGAQPVKRITFKGLQRFGFQQCLVSHLATLIRRYPRDVANLLVDECLATQETQKQVRCIEVMEYLADRGYPRPYYITVLHAYMHGTDVIVEVSAELLATKLYH